MRQISAPVRGREPTDADVRRELDECRASLAQMQAARDRAIAAERFYKSELRLVSAALMTSQEMERKRIAGELHDSIGQALSTISLIVGGAVYMLHARDTSGTEQMLLRASDQARQAIDEVRRIAMDLRPATLDNLGIIGTLSWFCREFRAIHADIAVVTDIEVSEIGLPAVLTTAIYRVVQEACHNVVRHAQASEIRLALHQRPGMIVLRVEDNGRGMCADDSGHRRSQGMGLRSMRDRVEFSGGTFCVASKPGAGSSVVAVWPLSGAYCRARESEEADPVLMAGEAR